MTDWWPSGLLCPNSRPFLEAMFYSLYIHTVLIRFWLLDPGRFAGEKKISLNCKLSGVHLLKKKKLGEKVRHEWQNRNRGDKDVSCTNSLQYELRAAGYNPLDFRGVMEAIRGKSVFLRSSTCFLLFSSCFLKADWCQKDWFAFLFKRWKKRDGFVELF